MPNYMPCAAQPYTHQQQQLVGRSWTPATTTKDENLPSVAAPIRKMTPDVSDVKKQAAPVRAPARAPASPQTDMVDTDTQTG